MAGFYGFDISRPAADAREAVQWTYFAYLAAVKDQDGAAMSLGRVATFLDIYMEQDLGKGILTRITSYNVCYTKLLRPVTCAQKNHRRH